MEPVAPNGPAALHRRACPRRSEIREILGGPRRCGQAPGSPRRRKRESVSAFAAAGAVLLYLPLPEGLPDAWDFLPRLPAGLRAFALYVPAHYGYLQGDYAASAGLAEGVLAMGRNRTPSPLSTSTWWR